MSQVTIVLNKEALEALFPEGSEQRLKLAEGAVKAVVNTALKKSQLSTEIVDYIDRSRVRVKDDLLKELGVTPAWSGSVSLTGAFIERVRQEALKQVTEEIRTAVAHSIEKAQVSIREQVEFTLNSRMNSDVKRLVGEAMAKAVAAALSMPGVSP